MYAKESAALREQVTEICMLMEGGLEWNTAWGVSFEDREIMIRVINKHIRAKNPDAPEYM